MADKLRQLNIPLPVQGSITVVQKETATVGAQLSIARAEQDTTLEEEFFMPSNSAPNEFYALALGVTGSPLIALRSSGSQTQEFPSPALQTSARPEAQAFSCLRMRPLMCARAAMIATTMFTGI